MSSLLLSIAQIPESDFEIVEASPTESVEMLLAGEIDAMLLISGVNAESMYGILTAPGIEILNFELAETYARLIPFLRFVTMLEGSLNISARRPAEDKHLLTDMGILVAEENLHPDLQMLLLSAAIETQDLMLDPFPSEEVFPTTEGLTLPVSRTTAQFLEEGRTALQRYLPFWIASPLERFYLLIFPIILLLYPLLRNTPVAYSAYMRRRVFVWYKRVRAIELDIETYSAAELQSHIDQLQTLQQELTETIGVPTGYLQTFYNLRVHIRLVIDRLRERLAYVQALGLGPDERPPRDDAPAVPPAQVPAGQEDALAVKG